MLASRYAIGHLSRLVPRFSRSYGTPVNPIHEHAEGGMKLWRMLTFLVALPAISVCMVNAYLGEKEHMEHFHRPEFKKWDHMYKREKKFPWGDGNHSLFHNPKLNALPEGYEDE